jgi:hypothetical protein
MGDEGLWKEWVRREMWQELKVVLQKACTEKELWKERDGGLWEQWDGGNSEEWNCGKNEIGEGRGEGA